MACSWCPGPAAAGWWSPPTCVWGGAVLLEPVGLGLSCGWFITVDSIIHTCTCTHSSGISHWSLVLFHSLGLLQIIIICKSRYNTTPWMCDLYSSNKITLLYTLGHHTVVVVVVWSSQSLLSWPRKKLRNFSQIYCSARFTIRWLNYTAIRTDCVGGRVYRQRNLTADEERFHFRRSIVRWWLILISAGDLHWLQFGLLLSCDL